jgi:hypothetical protein
MDGLSDENKVAYLRLMKIINKHGSPRSNHGLSGCWTHTMSSSSSGYGQITIGGKLWNLHRLSWWLHNGCPTEGNFCDRKWEITHACDNKECANPDHLALETAKKNKQDAVERIRVIKPKKEKRAGDYAATSTSFTKGHGAGEDNIKSILTKEKVIEIRRRQAKGLPYGGLKKMAEEFGVSYVTIQAIVGGRLWSAPEYFP